MFKSLRNRFRKRRFANTALLKANECLDYLFNSDEAHEKYIGVRVLKKKGQGAIQDLRKHIIQMVLEIVQSNNPIIAMRKALISNIRSDCMNRLLWTEEFHNRREVIYAEFNKDIEDPDLLWSDEKTASLAAWSEAESVCLRFLQMSMFEEVSKEDWWADYVKLYEEHVRVLYRFILAKADGDEPSIYSALVKASQDMLHNLERKVLEESE